MAKKVIKLTPDYLRQLVREEKRKFLAEKAQAVSASPELDAPAPKEVDAGDEADTLEKKVDMLATLKIKEARHLAELRKIRAVQKKITESIKRRS